MIAAAPRYASGEVQWRTGNAPAHWLPRILLAVLLGAFVFSHGCHGDDVDDELSIVPTPQTGEGSH